MSPLPPKGNEQSGTGPEPVADALLDEAFDWLLRIQAAPRDAGIRLAVEAWVAADPGHAKAYRHARDVWELTGRAPRMGAEPRRSPMVMPRRVGRRGMVGAIGLALAAAIAIAALPGLVGQMLADQRTATGEVRDVTLADGSVISLDGESAFRITAMSADRRQVALLNGRAFFEVASDPSRPFKVQAGDVEVTVHGTAFDVWMGEDVTSVAVAEGVVSVKTPDGDVELRPGDRTRIAVGSHAPALDRIDIGSVATWRQGQLTVNSMPIGEVVEEISRHRPGLVLLPDEAFAGKRVTGVFDLGDPTGALLGLVRTYGGEVIEITPYFLIINAAH